MAKHMDQVIAALDPAKPVTLYEIDVMCPKCGAREIYQSRDPKAPATAPLVCRRCTDIGL